MPSCIASRRPLFSASRNAVVALLHDKAGRSVEGRNVDGNPEVLVALGLLLGCFVIEEVGVNGSVVESRNGSVVVGELHEIRLGEILRRKDLLEGALDDAETLAGQVGLRLDLSSAVMTERYPAR